MNFFDKDFALAKLFFSLFPSYNPDQNDQASTWLGRYVRLLTNRVKAIPILGTIVNLIEKCFASSFGFNKKAEAREDVAPLQAEVVRTPPIQVDLVPAAPIKVVNPDLFPEQIEKKIDPRNFEEESAPPPNANVANVKDGDIKIDLENHLGIIDANDYLPEDFDEDDIMRAINQKEKTEADWSSIWPQTPSEREDGKGIVHQNDFLQEWLDEEELIRAIDQEEQKKCLPPSPKPKAEIPKGIVDQNDFLPEDFDEEAIMHAIDQIEKKEKQQNLPGILPANIELQRKEVPVLRPKLFGDDDL